MKKALLLIFLLSTQIFGFAQLPKPKIEWLANDPRLKLQDEVSDVKVDSKGNVWIITFSEVIRYDSRTFHRIFTGGVSFSSILKFGETPDSKGYVYDIRGAVFFIEDDTLKAYKHNSQITERYRGIMIYNIWFDENGDLYFTSQNVSFKIVGNNLVEIKNPVVDEQNYLALNIEERHTRIARYAEPQKGTWQNLLLIFDRDTIIDRIELSTPQYYNYPCLVKNSHDEYYFSTGLGDLLKIDSSRAVRKMPFKASILNLYTDSRNNLWINTRSLGVHFIPQGQFTSEGRFVLNDQSSLIVSAEDHEGGIWGYHNLKGPFRIQQPDVVFLDENEQSTFENKVIDLSNANDTLIISFPNKLLFWNTTTNVADKVMLPPNLKENNRDSILYAIQYDTSKNTLWAVQRGRILTYKRSKWRCIFDEKDNVPPMKTTLKRIGEQFGRKSYDFIAFERRGYCIYSYENNSTQFYKRFDENLQDIITTNDTIFILGEKNVYLRHPDSTVVLNKKYNALNDKIKDWAFFRKKLWFATNSKSIRVLTKDSLKPIFWNNEPINQAVIVKENEESLWFFTEDGSYNYSVLSDNLVYNGKNYQLTVWEPLPSFSTSSIAVIENRCFFGTTKDGLAIVDFNQLRKKPRIPPLLTIDHFSIGAHQSSQIDLNPEVSYSNNLLKVQYNGVSYKNSVNYQYRLSGLQTKWTSTTDNTVQFVNLAPGVYRFEVKARKGKQVWSETLSVPFVIRPPFWQTWWFILFSGILTVTLIYKVTAYRVSITNKHNHLKISRLVAEQRALRAKMDPHFVFNIISSLRYMILKENKELALNFLKRFSSLMRATLNQTDHEFIELNDEIEFLKKYIELEQLRLENSFDYSFHGLKTIQNQHIVIPSLTIQPIVENAIHHGLKNKVGPKKLELRFYMENNFLKVMVRDNGIGFSNKPYVNKRENKHQSHGLKILRERLKLYNGTNKVPVVIARNREEDAQEWTTITLLIKLNTVESTHN